MNFVGQGRCEDVLTYPLHVASVYRFCPSVPGFAVSLPSVLASQQTTLRLANRLHQLACERLTLSGIFGIFDTFALMLGAHIALMPSVGDLQTGKIISLSSFGSWDKARHRNPQSS